MGKELTSAYDMMNVILEKRRLHFLMNRFSAGAPKVVAKGKGKIAENILEKAKENNIPIQEDPSLVEILGQLNVNESIPEELYKAVSEVFAYIYQIDREHG